MEIRQRVEADAGIRHDHWEGRIQARPQWPELRERVMRSSWKPARRILCAEASIELIPVDLVRELHQRVSEIQLLIEVGPEKQQTVRGYRSGLHP